MRPKHDKARLQQSNSHANLVYLVQNTNKLYINAFNNMRIKTPQTISPNIKIKGNKIIGSNTRKHQEHSILSTNLH